MDTYTQMYKRFWLQLLNFQELHDSLETDELSLVTIADIVFNTLIIRIKELFRIPIFTLTPQINPTLKFLHIMKKSNYFMRSPRDLQEEPTIVALDGFVFKHQLYANKTTTRLKGFCVLFAFMLLQLNAAWSETYYLRNNQTANAHIPGNWFSGGHAGGGVTATNFTTADDIFIIGTNQTARFPNGTHTVFGRDVTLRVNGKIGLNGSGVLNISLTIEGIIRFNSTLANQFFTNNKNNSSLLSFNLSDDATLSTMNNNGLQGHTDATFAVNGMPTGFSVNLSSNALYVFNGDTQSTEGLPSLVKNLTFSGTGIKTLANNVNVSGNLVIQSGAVLEAGSNTIDVAGNWTSSGNFVCGTSSVILRRATVNLARSTDFFNLSISDATTVHVEQNISLGVNGLFNIGGGNINLKNGALLILNGTVSRNTGTINAKTTGTFIIVSGNANVSLPAGLFTQDTVANFRINKTNTPNNDIVTLNGPLHVKSSTVIISGNLDRQSHAFSSTNCVNVIPGTNLISNGGIFSCGPALIEGGTYEQLVVTDSILTIGGTTTVQDITINTNKTLNLDGNKLTITGTISGSGLISGNDSSELEIAGLGSTSTILFDQNSDKNRLRRLIVNHASGLNIGNRLVITEELIPEAGIINTGGNLVLKSGPNGTARIASGGCSTCNYITGNVIVERHVPALPNPGVSNSFGRRWRFLSSAALNATLSDWKSEIFITGPGASANGFDGTNTSSSVFYYDETNTANNLNTGWVSPSNINHVLEAGRGYRVFVRGDRSNPSFLTSTTIAATAVTVDVNGPVNTGNITVTLHGTNSGAGNSFDALNDGWNFLGNPYPSDYDWKSFWNDNNGIGQQLQNIIEPTIWIYDATSASYKTYNPLIDEGTITSGIIPSGAAFFVKKIASGNGILTFKESYKTSTQAMNLFKSQHNSSFKIRMMLDSSNYDDLLIKYVNNATQNKDMYDVAKMYGSVNISSYGSDNQMLAVSARPLATLNDTIRLNVSGANGQYKMYFMNSDKIAVLDNVQLIDQYTSQVIDLKTTSSYQFSISNTIAGSFGPNRFLILVSTPGSVPVNLLTFNAYSEDNQIVKLAWATGSEINSEAFDIERSSNGITFEPIGAVKAQGTTQMATHYQFIDAAPQTTNYYRLRMVDQDGSFTYSEVRKVELTDKMQNNIQLVNIYPIPALSDITIDWKGEGVIQSIHVYNTMGELIESIDALQTESYNLNLSTWKQGVYFAELISTYGQSSKTKIIVGQHE